MPSTRYEDLYDAAAVVDTEQQLQGRLDSSVDGVTSSEGEHKRVTGLAATCSNTGYLILRLSGNTLATLDIAVVNGLTEFAELDIDVPVGQTLAVYEMSTSGTGSCAVTVRYEVE